jgi:ribosomal protein L34
VRSKREEGPVAVVGVEVPYHGLEVLIKEEADDVGREDTEAALMSFSKLGIWNSSETSMSAGIRVVHAQGVSASQRLAQAVVFCARLVLALQAGLEVPLEAIPVGWAYGVGSDKVDAAFERGRRGAAEHVRLLARVAKPEEQLHRARTHQGSQVLERRADARRRVQGREELSDAVRKCLADAGLEGSSSA